ncbi:lipocalin family protein [Thiohalophilus sp.]|uniref:lipocalin family protein n=1 Tax=Thiohalophilus sp. TaxID=3028392 RepID=UPI002ACD91E0|nr:lipocalin family protein [Thiohalophilus sp.]MDZ7804524.1 lipocalin family protein [Thiohalophilus sp.]
MKPVLMISTALLTLAVTGCGNYPPIRTAEQVDLPRFMGDWYVIANIPTFIETGAHNAVESYSLNEDGTIATTFSFRKDSFEGEKKVYHPTGYIFDRDANAVWGMQFIWPIKADYRIVYVDEDYTHTIIGRLKRDYVWIMARTPQIGDATYKKLITILHQEGYDTGEIQRVPQSWPEPSSPDSGSFQSDE